MSLYLGLFQQFKGADTLLISGTPADISDLSDRLSDFAASGLTSWPVHGMAQVSVRNPAELFARRTPQPHATGHMWLCSPDSIPAIQDKLHALASSGLGHHYFDLLESPVQLLVSVGEYSESWWSSAGA
jgi:hypothetical protein